MLRVRLRAASRDELQHGLLRERVLAYAPSCPVLLAGPD